jgi:restriction endonuclease S subunit
MLRSIEPQINGNTGSTFASINRNDICKLKIPLPPLSVQEEIVAELDSYQKIIDGAKQVVDNWKPKIDIDPEWVTAKLKDVCSFEYGKGLPEKDRISGPYPVLGSNGVAGYHNRSFVKGPVIVVGRKGSAGEVVWEESDCWPIDTTYYITHEEKKIAYRYLYYTLKMATLQNLRGGTGIPGLNRNDAYDLEIYLPDLPTQLSIVNRIDSEQKLIDANRELIKLYEQKIKDRIERLWKSKQKEM